MQFREYRNVDHEIAPDEVPHPYRAAGGGYIILESILYYSFILSAQGYLVLDGRHPLHGAEGGRGGGREEGGL